MTHSPDTPATPEGDAISRAAEGLRRIVEEIDGAMNHGTWRDDHGVRLKDTPEWVAFYNATSLRALTAQPVAQDTRSFPDAADGRPMPSMGDELMIAGLSWEDARFVAHQLAQNGLMLVSATPAPVEAGLIEALRSGEQADMDGCRVKVSREACEKAADILSALQPGDGWLGIESAKLDRSQMIVAVPDQHRTGWIVGEAYYDPEAKDWFWAGTSANDYFGGPISELNHWLPELWQPMPEPSAPPASLTGEETR